MLLSGNSTSLRHFFATNSARPASPRGLLMSVIAFYQQFLYRRGLLTTAQAKIKARENPKLTTAPVKVHLGQSRSGAMRQYSL